MKDIFFAILLISSCIACQKTDFTVPSDTYDCTLSIADESATHPAQADFQAVIDRLAKVTPGVQVAIRTADNKTWTGAAGIADIPNNIALEKCTKIMAGSVSKPVTATLIMQLQDEGLLRIDDPLTDWLEADLISEIANSDKVTIRHLLKHTSGIPDYLDINYHLTSINTDYYLLTQREKVVLVHGKPATHEPDEAYNYSNTNYVLLGLIVEKARKMPLWDAVDTFIAQPLGLAVFEFGTEENPIPDDTARPYAALRGDKYIDAIHFAVSDAATGDGGLATNAQDLNLFIEGLFAGKLLSTESLTEMMEDRITVGNQDDFEEWEDETSGLGLVRFNTPYGTAFGHTGSTSTYNAILLHFPEQGASFSIITNGVNLNGGNEQAEAFEELLELMFG